MVHPRLRRAGRAALTEPLVWFAAVAVLLLAWPGGAGPDADEPLLAEGEAERLASAFARRSGRAPTEAEAAALVRARQDEALLAREARVLGLDRDDPVVRARLVRKMEAALAAGPPPDEAAVRAAYDADPERYALPARVAFEQRLLPDGADAALEAGRPVAHARSSLPARLESTPLSEVAFLFGPGFADALADLPTGRWAGPVASPYGAHLVRVTGRRAAVVPSFAEVEGRVRADLAEAEAAARREAGLARLRAEAGLDDR